MEESGTYLTETEKQMEPNHLVERAVAGDVSAFEQLMRENMKTILYQTRRYIHKPEDAEDAAQEAIIAMYQSIGTLQNTESFKPWMYRLIKFTCLKYVRTRDSGPNGGTLVDVDEYAEYLPDESRGSDPAEWLEDRERLEAIVCLINGLPEKQRESIILYFYDGLTYREIAQAMGNTIKTVSTNIMKAKKNILKGIKEEDLGSMLTAAISLDAGAKLAGINLTAVHQAAMAGVGNAAMHTTSGAAGIARTRRGQGASVLVGICAAAVCILAISSGSLFPAGSAPNAPASQAPPPAVTTPVTPPAAPTVQADIVFTGGECPCGHLNPQSAALDLQGHDLSVISWAILSGNVEIRNGNGRVAAISPGALAEGDYLIRYTIAGEGGMKANAERAFTVLHGNYDPALFD
ncbi:MAG: sigma-70 family RNA polymerase sigma factor [Clostridiales bacterium]|nr:sigma-70 family RNA polymerase sigma factor [Clostridiales bacterium]